jgi:hypothetical protein
MNSQKKQKNTLYPDDFNDDDKLNYDILFEQSKQLFPNLIGDEWLLRMGILAYMRKEKQGATEPPTDEEINNIKSQYKPDAVYFTEAEDCPVVNDTANLIVVE